MIQIDMEMPKCCILCQFFHTLESEDYDKHNFNESAISFRRLADGHLRRIETEQWLKNRHCNCPLKEVKERCKNERR